MPTYHEITAGDRLAHVGEVMPRFASFVREGDELLLGLESDNLFPYADGPRPMGKVTRVQPDAGGVALTLKMQDGSTKHIDANSVDPGSLWEWTEKSFNDVVGRAVEAESAPAASSSAAAAPRSTTFEDLAEQVGTLKNMFFEMANEMQASQQFQANTVRTFNQVIKDVQHVRDGEPCEFCDLFATQFKSTLGSDDSSSESSLTSFSSEGNSLLDYESMSSASSESSEASDLSSLSSSSEGSEFARNLLL